MTKPKPDYKQLVLDNMPCVTLTISRVCKHDHNIMDNVLKELTEEDKIYKRGIVWFKR